jgi:hypothetical protein
VTEATSILLDLYNQTPTPREEATQVEMFDPNNLPNMGFDHRQIVADALSAYRSSQ